MPKFLAGADAGLSVCACPCASVPSHTDSWRALPDGSMMKCRYMVIFEELGFVSGHDVVYTVSDEAEPAGTPVGRTGRKSAKIHALETAASTLAKDLEDKAVTPR